MADSTNINSPQLRSRLATSVVAGVASGLLTLIDPAKLEPSTRSALYLGTGAVAGATAWFGSAQEEPLKSRKAVRGALALGLAGLGVASTKLGFVLDAKIHQALLRHGISNPRPVMAVGSGILTALTFLVDELGKGPGLLPVLDDSEEQLPIRDLPQPVRELIEGMLGHTNDFGAEILRGQLDGAREQYWGDPEEFGFQLDLVVPADATRTVPRDYTFPVHAGFKTAEGQPIRVSLTVSDGRMAALTLDVDHEAMKPAEDSAMDPLESIMRWPLRSEVVYSLER